MTWNTPGDTMQMFCWWKANSEADINNQLGQMNDFFVKSMTSDKAACQMTWNTPDDKCKCFAGGNL